MELRASQPRSALAPSVREFTNRCSVVFKRDTKEQRKSRRLYWKVAEESRANRIRLSREPEYRKLAESTDRDNKENEEEEASSERERKRLIKEATVEKPPAIKCSKREYSKGIHTVEDKGVRTNKERSREHERGQNVEGEEAEGRPLEGGPHRCGARRGQSAAA